MTEREINAVILHADGNAEIRYVTRGAEELHEIVGGWLQGINATTDRGFGPWFAYVNEEGKIEGLPINGVANDLLADLGWMGAAGGDFVVGTVVIVGADPSGEDIDVPDAVLQHVLAYFREHGEVALS